MRQDIDRLMEERNLDAAVLSGYVQGNPNMAYMLRGADVSGGIVIKKRGETPCFLYSPIERDEARATGMTLINQAKYDYVAILRKTGDPLAARVELYRRVLAELDVQGEVGFYGMADQGASFLFLQALDQALPGVKVRGEYVNGLFDVARATKDAEEVDRIRQVGRLTGEVIAETVAFMRRHRVREETLLLDDGSPLTIGVVKNEIRRLLAERGLEDPEGVIFAIGHDGGVPHSKGNPGDPIKLGQPIVYDLFPRRHGGYFFDCTRTISLGYAAPEVRQVYQDVSDCVDAVVDAIAVGVEARILQQTACSFFEQRGYKTVASDPQAEEGYVHSISHGLGLAVHEEPHFSDVPSNTQTLQPGHVFTVEPGLYYPERGYGVRIEDVIWIDEQGVVHNLTELPRELVVEL
ncbi:MAG: aminopeptidase P family protein [Anaerolineae bacterium]|nr:aminopeptidase P family protein [Anaerolineae bacterium]